MLRAKKSVSEPAIILIAVPLITWLADRLILAKAWRSEKIPPTISDTSNPSQTAKLLPGKNFSTLTMVSAQEKEPIIIKPSKPILTTPLRSQ